MQTDAAYIKGSKDVFVPGEKTKISTRWKECTMSVYSAKTLQNINDTYNKVNQEARDIASGLCIADRINEMAKRESL